jgi:quercetin dioxygenase-like cupin family protein
MRGFAFAAFIAVAACFALFQPAMSADAPAFVRTLLLAGDAPGGNILTMMQVTLPAGGREGRHKHSGPLMVHVTSGVFTIVYEGKPTTTYKAGDTFYVEAGKIHEGFNKGAVPAVGIASFVTPKGAPITVAVK